MYCRNLLLTALTFMLFVSCRENRIARDLRDFRTKTVVIPADLHKVNGRTRTEAGDIEKIPVLVLYHDSLSCNTCQISHLADLSDIYALADSLGTFEVMCIFSPRQEEYDEVMKNLIYRNFEYPVYVDFSGSFRKQNICIPEDPAFHSFFIDKDGHPLFVGNPAASDDLWRLFNEALQKID